MTIQTRIQNPVEHLRLSFFVTIVNRYSRYLFSQKIFIVDIRLGSKYSSATERLTCYNSYVRTPSENYLWYCHKEVCSNFVRFFWRLVKDLNSTPQLLTNKQSTNLVTALSRGVFTTQSNIYDEAFLRKQLAAFSR